MPFADAFNAPLVETIGGETYKLVPFTMDDLAGVSREILNEQKQKAISEVAITNTAARQETAAWFDAIELDVEELSKVVKTLPGAKRFLCRSFIRGGNPTEKITDFLQGLAAERGYRGLVNLACEVSRLWPTPARKPEGSGPNAGSPPADSSADGVTDPAPTGVSTASSSAAPSADQTPANSPI